MAPNSSQFLLATFVLEKADWQGHFLPAREGVDSVYLWHAGFSVTCRLETTTGCCYPIHSPGKFSKVRDKLQAVRWALARLTFISYIVFSVVTLVGGFLTAPLMTWYFFGDWRFWRYWRAGFKLLPHGLRLTAMMPAHSRAFMFSVPLASPPRSAPDPVIAENRSDWPHGNSCGDCSNCCRPGGTVCPLLDSETQACRGYNSFYWRYFNCGRYPSVVEEINYYDCRKWALKTAGLAGTATRTVNPALRVAVGSLRREQPQESAGDV